MALQCVFYRAHPKAVMGILEPFKTLFVPGRRVVRVQDIGARCRHGRFAHMPSI